MSDRRNERKAKQLKMAVERLFQAQAKQAPRQTMLSIAYSTDPPQS